MEVVDNVIEKVETGVAEKLNNNDQELMFTIDFENSESSILRNDDLDSEEMIQAIVDNEQMLDQERLFLLEYAL